MATIPRIGLRRTQAVDDLLTKIWALRPELERKNSITIVLGLESFLRECQANSQPHHLEATTASSAPDRAVNVEPTNDVLKDEFVSDDIEW